MDPSSPGPDASPPRRRGRAALFVLGLIALGVGGTAFWLLPLEAPTAAVADEGARVIAMEPSTDGTLTGLPWRALAIEVPVSVMNPNRIGATLDGFAGDVYWLPNRTTATGAYVGSIRLDAAEGIPAAGRVILPMRFSWNLPTGLEALPVSPLANLSNLSLLTNPLTFVIHGNASIALPGGAALGTAVDEVFDVPLRGPVARAVRAPLTDLTTVTLADAGTLGSLTDAVPLVIVRNRTTGVVTPFGAIGDRPLTIPVPLGAADEVFLYDLVHVTRLTVEEGRMDRVVALKSLRE